MKSAAYAAARLAGGDPDVQASLQEAARSDLALRQEFQQQMESIQRDSAKPPGSGRHVPGAHLQAECARLAISPAQALCVLSEAPPEHRSLTGELQAPKAVRRASVDARETATGLPLRPPLLALRLSVFQ